jgi:NAD(P)-dependent dehydrogenase (short-subunit alcohol dehydrogenase family)
MSVVLITGCSSGIGLHTAMAFAKNGDAVVASMRNPAKAVALKSAAAAAGVEVEVVALDVTDDASASAAVTDVLARHGKIDVLVNNAGVGLSGPVEDFPMDQARTCIETNFWGPVRMSRLVLPSMRAQGSGVIANVSSITARLPAFPAYGFYAAGKYAVNAMSESLSAEVAPFGIRVLSIEPGYFTTELVATIDSLLNQMNETSPYAEVSRFMMSFSKNALITGGNPADVGTAIVAAVSDTASPLHVTVGADTEVFLDVWKNTGTFESFSAAMTEMMSASV